MFVCCCTVNLKNDDSCQEPRSVTCISEKFSCHRRGAKRVSTKSLAGAVGSSVALPTVLAVVCALAQRIDLAVQAKGEVFSQVSSLQAICVQVHCRLSGLQASALQLASTRASLSLVCLRAFTWSILSEMSVQYIQLDMMPTQWLCNV